MILTTIWIVLIILGLVYRKSKIILYYQIAFTILIFSLSSGVADRQNYIVYYEQVVSNPDSVSGTNFIFKYFYYFFGQFGNFQFLVFATAAIGLLLIVRIICKNTFMVSFVYSLYMISPFVIDVVQMRNFLAMVVLFNFVPYIMSFNGDLKNIIKYLWGVFLAGSIHPSFFYFSVFAIIPFVSLKKIRIIILSIVTSTIVIGSTSFIEKMIRMTMVMFERYNLRILNTVLQKYYAYRYLYNYESLINRYIMLIVAFIIISFIGLCIKADEKINKNSYSSDLLLKINWLTILVLPLIAFSYEFYRMQRNILLLVYLISSRYLETRIVNKDKVKKYKLGIYIGNIMLALFYLYIDVFLWNASVVYDPLFFI